MSCDISTHNTTGKCGQNVTFQEAEGGHDVTSEISSTLRWVDVKYLDVVNGGQNVTGNICHSGPNVQWTFRVGRNVTRTSRGVDVPSRHHSFVILLFTYNTAYTRHIGDAPERYGEHLLTEREGDTSFLRGIVNTIYLLTEEYGVYLMVSTLWCVPPT